MSISKIDINEFLSLAGKHPILDVRSPGEYKHAHIPGAISFPLFTDGERKTIGTSYKQISRELAIKQGLDFFGPKMRPLVEAAEALSPGKAKDKCFLVHCWRGGMRSAAIAWLLDLYGYEVKLLKGGYKDFRRWTATLYNKPHNFAVIGGYTGSGKTIVLKAIAAAGEQIIDLEGLAKHRGSAFGAVPGQDQPSQEMFENLLAFELAKKNVSDVIWLEDESQRLGHINLPNDFWTAMRKSPVVFLEIPFEERLAHIVTEYGALEKEKLINAVIRIQKRLGGLDTKNAINFLLENNLKESFRILLRYYDKHYLKGLNNRESTSIVIPVNSDTTDAVKNKDKILAQKNLLRP